MTGASLSTVVLARGEASDAPEEWAKCLYMSLWLVHNILTVCGMGMKRKYEGKRKIRTARLAAA